MTVTAQDLEYDFQNFSIEDGLSNQLVNTVFEGSKGFIWVGTNYGLNRFDGHEFKSFTSEKNGIIKNKVNDLYEDKNNKLWIVYMEFTPLEIQLSIFDKETEQALSFSEAFPDAPFEENEITDISTSTKDRSLWISTRSGRVFNYDEKFKLVVENEKYAFAKMNVLKDEVGVWLGVKNHLFHLDEHGKELKRISIPKGKIISIPKGKIGDFGRTKDGKIWCVVVNDYRVHGSMFLIDENDQMQEYEFQEIYDKSTPFYDLNYYLDKNGNENFIWTGTEKMVAYNTEGQQLYNFIYEIRKKIPRCAIVEIAIDSNNNLWVGTTGGLVLITPKEELFQTYLTDKAISLRGITKLNEEELFIASYNGFFAVNKINKAERKISFWTSGYRPPYGIGALRIKDQIWVGFHGWGYCRYNINSNEMEFNPTPEDNFSPDFFFQDKYENIWVGGKNGVRVMDSELQKVIFPSNAILTEPIYNISVNHIQENKEGLWLSTDQGLFLINYSGEVLKRIKELEVYPINFSHQTSDGNFWLTTKGSGLLHWNPKSRTIERRMIEDGLPHNYLYSIHEDDLGVLWMPSNNGLIRFNPKDFTINSFSKSDGLPSQEFNTFSYYEGEDGKIYLGTLNGLVAFNPNDFKFIDDKNSPLEIISFAKFNMNEVGFVDKTKELIAKKEISFLSEDRFIELKFSLLDFKNSFNSKYAYKIEGYDNDWKYLDENILRINKLPYGDYVLKIKGQGSYGKWSDNILEIALDVPKPFYFLTWFLFFVSLLLFAIGYGVFRWRIFRLKKEKETLEEKVLDRTQELAKTNKLKDDFFAIIAHDLRAPVISFQNISNRIKYLMQQGDEKDIEKMLHLVDNAAENLNVLLDNLLSWAMVQKGIFPYKPVSLNLKELSDETISLFQPMAKLKGIQLQQKIENHIVAKADKDAMSAVIRNLMSNAIKFSKHGDQVKISAKKIDANVQVIIEDSGVGIPDKIKSNIFSLTENKINRGTNGEKGSGIGLALCKHLMELNHGKIEVKSEIGKGSSFSVMIPVG